MSQQSVGDAPGGGDGTREWDEWVAVVGDVLNAAMGREEVIECAFEDLQVDVPIRIGPDAECARWQFDGTVTVHVKERHGPLAEWLRWWYRKLPSGTDGDPPQR